MDNANGANGTAAAPEPEHFERIVLELKTKKDAP
jgi:hypothetical protein